jgi:peptidoglycan/LPS O-acetylase OafA/YrhL
VRLYPAFWVALLLTSAMTVAWGAASGLSVDAPQVVANMTMVPQVLGVAVVDGVYWTLLLEVAFYGLVFCWLVVGRLELFATLLPAWPFVVLVATLLTGVREDALFVGGYFALFASGAIVAEIGRRGWSVWRTAGLAAGCAAALVSVTRHEEALVTETGQEFSVPVAATILLACFALVLLLNVPGVQSWRLPGAATLGNLTYPVYLVHAHAGYMVLTHWATAANRWWVYGATLAAVLAVAWAIHEVVERRLRRRWYRVFDVSVGRVSDLITSGVGRAVPRGREAAAAAERPAVPVP